MKQLSLFDDVKKPEVKPEPEVVSEDVVKPEVEEKMVTAPVWKHSGGGITFKAGDCVFREGNKCSKTGRSVAVDARDVSCLSCWERMCCKFFERRR